MSTDKIPTISLGKVQAPDKPAKKAAKDPEPRQRRTKAKARKADKAKAKKGKGKGKRAPKPDLSRVPTNMVPPEIPDSRPVHVPEPEPEQEPTVPAPALFADPEPDASPITVAEMEEANLVQEPVRVDTRLFQGATCTWIGPMEDAPDHPDTGKPVCPHCKSNLLTCPDRATIELGAEQYELGAYDAVNPAPRRHPGYKALLSWVMEQSRTQCWPTIEEAAVEYQKVTGKAVDPTR